MPRRKISTPLTYIPGPEPKSTRSRDGERKQRAGSMKTVTYRHIPEELRDRIKEIAEEHQVRVDDVARAMLEYALADFEAGELQFTPILKTGKFTLFPEK
jgi:hypothetical protein